MAKGTKTGGRKKGTPNKRTARTKHEIKAAAQLIEGVIPEPFQGDAHDLLMAIYKDPSNQMHTRMEAAKAALPYEKARLASIEHTGKEGGPITITWLTGQS